MLSTVGIKATDIDKKDAKKHIRIMSPEADSNYRLISQAGLLLRMPSEYTTPKDTETVSEGLEGYVKKERSGEIHQPTFTKIKIHSTDRDRHDCLAALNKMNINHMTLFQDIDGAAKYINSLWQPGHEDLIAHV